MPPRTSLSTSILFEHLALWSKAFFSGILPADAVADIVEYARQNDGVFTVPQQWCTFNSHGHGYARLAHWDNLLPNSREWQPFVWSL